MRYSTKLHMDIAINIIRCVKNIYRAIEVQVAYRKWCGESQGVIKKPTTYLEMWFSFRLRRSYYFTRHLFLSFLFVVRRAQIPTTVTYTHRRVDVERAGGYARMRTYYIIVMRGIAVSIGSIGRYNLIWPRCVTRLNRYENIYFLKSQWQYYMLQELQKSRDLKMQG